MLTAVVLQTLIASSWMHAIPTQLLVMLAGVSRSKPLQFTLGRSDLDLYRAQWRLRVMSGGYTRLLSCQKLGAVRCGAKVVVEYGLVRSRTILFTCDLAALVLRLQEQETLARVLGVSALQCLANDVERSRSELFLHVDLEKPSACPSL